jgi:two-component system, LytTR family, response regulator
VKVLIVDNERPICEATRELLLAFCPEVEQIEMANDIPGALALVRHFQPDMLFLDVELDDGFTGFDLLRQLQNPNFELVFVTAHDKYAIDAFRFSAIDFLLKPIDPDALMHSVQKAARHRQNQHLNEQITFLLDRMASPSEANKRLVLKDANHIYYLRPQEIRYCEADGVYTRFFVENSSPITVSKNLKEYEQILEPLGFLRTHNSYLVNPDKILRYDKNNDTLLLEGGLSVPLSQRKKEAILRWLEQK